MNNFTIFFNFVEINLSSLLHVDVICLNFSHLKQRFYFEKIKVSLLNNWSTAFDDKLKKRSLLLKKVFRENETNTKIFEKSDVLRRDSTLFLLIYLFDNTLCFIELKHIFIDTLTLIRQFIYVFNFKCYRNQTLNLTV